MEITGVIIKGVGGFYYVDTGEAVYECRARGRFRLEETTPLVGDRVAIERTEGAAKGFVTEILPRENELLRPRVANINRFVLVVSAGVPKPDLLLADKLLIHAAAAGAVPVICLNKCDAGDAGIIASVREQYAATGAKLLLTSAVTGEGLDGLKAEISGNICCFAGQSAVGKSSLLNAISPGLSLKTGGLAKKTDRGRHTTRHAELVAAAGGYVVDTPGFSLIELLAMEPEELCGYYPEMAEHIGKCRFDDCMHDAEPGCAVKEAVERGDMHRERHERYRTLLAELRELKKRRYD